MGNDEIFLWVAIFLIGGAVFAFRNRKKWPALALISNWEWRAIVALALSASVLVGIVENVSLPSMVAGLLLAPVFGFFAKEILSFLWRSVKYLTRFALKESLGLRMKKKKRNRGPAMPVL